MDTLKLGYSTCPNDTYIFGPLAMGLVRLDNFRLEFILSDVEELNRWARSGGPDICKVSVAAMAGLLDGYWMLRAGGAMGFGCGPLLVAKRPLDIASLHGKRVAVPGRMTTAALLLGLMLQEMGVEVEFCEMVFDRIMDAIAAEEVQAGVIIHEGRFTYQRRGLVMLRDLGNWWEESRGLPIPLGTIAIRRSLGLETAQQVNSAIRRSLAVSRRDESVVWPYVSGHAQEMDNGIMLEHIRTFVTAYSADVGVDGEAAMQAVVREACRVGGQPEPDLPLFVPGG